MGKNQKIPYLTEVLFYLGKVIILFLILNYLIAQTPLYNQSLILILSIFLAFSYNPFYLVLIVSSYLFSFRIAIINIGEFGLLFLYLFTVLLNTLFMIIYLKIKYKFKEEE